MITSDVFAAVEVDALEVRQLREHDAYVACVKPYARRLREDQRCLIYGAVLKSKE